MDSNAGAKNLLAKDARWPGNPSLAENRGWRIPEGTHRLALLRDVGKVSADSILHRGELLTISMRRRNLPNRALRCAYRYRHMHDVLGILHVHHNGPAHLGH